MHWDALCTRCAKRDDPGVQPSLKKQSFEYARSYCNWLSLDRTARANGIKSTTRWLNEFFRAFTQHCLDWTLSKRSDESYTDSVNIQRYDEGVYAEFDFVPWLAWNWKPAADC